MANATQMTTGKVRFSYVNLITPKEEQGSEKYTVTLLIPKSDKATLDKINACIRAAKENYTAKTKKPVSSGLKSSLHDGDDERPTGGPYGPECKNCYVLTVSSKNRPKVVDAQRVDITDPQEFFSGCYGRAIISWYVYDTNGNKGITASINGAMKLYDGEPLGGGVVTDADWDDGWTDDETDDLLR